MTQTLETLKNCITLLESTNSSNDKVEILRRFPQLQQFLGTILDPLKKTGISRESVLKHEREKFPKFHTSSHKKYPTAIEKVMDQLISREITGDDAKEMVVVTMRRYPEHRELILRIVEKDLKTRMGMSIFRQAFHLDEDKVTVPKTGKKRSRKEATDEAEEEEKSDISFASYSPALAHDFQKHVTYFQDSIKSGKDRWYISRKLDGVRCQVWSTPPVRALSRSGRPFPSLVLLQKMVQATVPAGYVLDGEVCVVLEDGSESFKDAVSHVKRKEPMKRFCFCVLDVLTETEFQLKTSQLTFSQRLARGKELLKPLLAASSTTQKVVWVDQDLYTEQIFLDLQRRAEDKKWEGLMLRKDVGYAGKRTKDLLKVKKFSTEEYAIEDVKVGPFRVIDPKTGLETTVETVTAVQIRHKGYPVFVGSGFSLKERSQMYKNQAAVKGKVIAVQYFEETQDKNGNLSLRFPTFKCWYGNSRDS